MFHSAPLELSGSICRWIVHRGIGRNARLVATCHAIPAAPRNGLIWGTLTKLDRMALVPGTKDPVSGPDEVVAFAQEHGLPVAIKAAYGGGGRGLKVARTIEEIPELFDSAVR